MPCCAGTEEKHLHRAENVFCDDIRLWIPPVLQQEPLAQQRSVSRPTDAELTKTQGASGDAARWPAEFLHLPGLGHS